MKAEELDRLFDEGKDISGFLDLGTATRPGHAQRRVAVDFPVWMVEALDFQAKRLGVTRQAIIKLWIAEKLRQEQSPPAP